MRSGDKVLCIKNYWNFDKGKEYFISSVWKDGANVKFLLINDGSYIVHGHMSFSKERLEEYFTNLELKRRLKLRRISVL